MPLRSVSVYATVAYGLGLALMLTCVCVGLLIGRQFRRVSIPIDDPAMLDMVCGSRGPTGLARFP